MVCLMVKGRSFNGRSFLCEPLLHDSMNVQLARIMKRSLVGFKHLVTRTFIKRWLLVANVRSLFGFGFDGRSRLVLPS